MIPCLVLGDRGDRKGAEQPARQTHASPLCGWCRGWSRECGPAGGWIRNAGPELPDEVVASGFVCPLLCCQGARCSLGSAQ